MKAPDTVHAIALECIALHKQLNAKYNQLRKLGVDMPISYVVSVRISEAKKRRDGMR